MAMRAAWRLTPFGNLGCSRSMFRRFASTSTLPPTIRQLLQTDVSNQPTRVEVNGWVKSVRKQKKIAFAAITDGSSQQPLQAVFTNVDLAKSLTNGACVRLQGVLSASPGRGQDKEIQVDAVECLGECDPNDYPIQKQDLSVEYLRDHCHLRARTPRMASMLRLRDQTQQALHDHFKAEDFTYVHTPILTANDCEGAGETFRIAPSSHTTSPDQRAADTEEEFFGCAAYLTVSSQLHLEALATSVSRVYTLSPCFRAERSQTGRHLSEFWMLEAEWAFTRNVSDVCRVVEGAVKSALQQRSEDLVFLRQSLDDSRRSFLEDTVNSQKPWEMVSYGDAVKELEQYQAATRTFHYEPKWGEPLHSEHERWISEQLVKGPVFVTDYPSSLKPFYMRINEDGRTVACFDLLVPYLGELVGGSLREERHDVLLKNLKTHNLDPEEFSWYLDLRKYGGAPHGGFGLGFDRLIQWISGIENIRECIPMPRYAGRMLL